MRNARILHEWNHKGERWAFFLCEGRVAPEPAEVMGTLLQGQMMEPGPEQQIYGICSWEEDPFGNGHWSPNGGDPQKVSEAVFAEFERLVMAAVVS